MFRDVPGCSGMFQNVPECSGMFHVPGFIDAHFSSERQTRFSEFETVLLSSISCYRACAVKHVRKFSFACFSLEVV